MKEIALIIPGYNCDKYINRCFDSILNQCFSSLQIIFVNDGSTDDSAKIADSYKNVFAKKDIEYIQIDKKKNEGQASAFNDALPLVNSKYITWMDIDDYLNKDSLKIRHLFLEENIKYDFCLSYLRIVDEKDITSEKAIIVKKEGSNYFKDIIINNNTIWGPGSIMVRTDFFFSRIPSKTIFNSRVGQNYQLLLPITYNSSFHVITSPLCTIVETSGSHSRRKTSNIDIIDKNDAIIDVVNMTLKRMMLDDLITKEECDKWREINNICLLRHSIELLKASDSFSCKLYRRLYRRLRCISKTSKKENKIFYACFFPFSCITRIVYNRKHVS